MLRRAALLSSGLTSAGVKNGIIQDDWDTIGEICKAGRAQDFYSIGDMKSVSMTDGHTYRMQIAGFNVDIKSDLSGMANITWIVKDVYPYPESSYSGVAWNSFANPIWSESPGRKYCNETIFNAMDSNVRKKIVSVRKYQSGAKSGIILIDSSDDFVWVSSYREMSDPCTYPLFENEGNFTYTASGSGWTNGQYHGRDTTYKSNTSSLFEVMPRFNKDMQLQNVAATGFCAWVRFGFCT